MDDIGINVTHNVRNSGFDIASLNSMYYKNNVIEDENEWDPHSCQYVLPNQLEPFNGITIFSFNIRSMVSNFDSFSSELLYSNKLFDVMGFCETHLTDSTDRPYTIDGFNQFTRNNVSNKGGVCIYIRNNIVCRERNDLSTTKEHLEAVFIECLLMKKSMIIGMIYRRPETSIDRFMEDMVTTLDKISDRCILMGDFNLNLLKVNDNIQVQNFTNLMTQYSFYPTVTKPSRVAKKSATLIDHIWINFDVQKESRSNIIFTGITDHFPVTLKLPTGQNNTSKLITYRSSGENCDYIFKQRLENTDFSEVIDLNDVNRSFDKFNSIIFALYDECYPLVTKIVKLNKNTNPWITAGLRQSTKTKNKLYKIFLKKPITYGNA